MNAPPNNQQDAGLATVDLGTGRVLLGRGTCSAQELLPAMSEDNPLMHLTIIFGQWFSMQRANTFFVHFLLAVAVSYSIQYFCLYKTYYDMPVQVQSHC